MSAQRMKLSHFRFDLPEEQIARYPLDNRDDAMWILIPRLSIMSISLPNASSFSSLVCMTTKLRPNFALWNGNLCF